MKKFGFVVVCLCCIFVVGFAGYRGYTIWKQKHLLTQARAYLAKEDLPNTLLCLRQLLQRNPKNLEACRLMADYAEAARSPQAVVWRSRVLELEPESLNSRLALARAALAAGDGQAALTALNRASPEHKNTAAFHSVAGVVDLELRRFREAEEHFSEATRLEPANPVSRLNAARLRVARTNDQAAAEGRAWLETLSTNSLSAVRCESLRVLMLDAFHHTNLSLALAFSQQVLAETNSNFSDRLNHLDVLRACENSEQGSFLEALKAESTNNPARAYEVAKWLLLQTKTKEALAWVQSLPPVTRTNLPVPLVEADIQITLQNWSDMVTNLATQSWGELECSRMACLSRAYREQGMAASAKTAWLGALRATDQRGSLLTQLLAITGRWNWRAEQEDVLWAIVDRFPKEQWATQALSERLYNEGRTSLLLTLFRQAAEKDRTNLMTLNNLAVTALLLERWDQKPHELAREVYMKEGTNAAYVSTYAYSLLVQQKPAEALKIIEQLQPAQLRNPGTAAYYGIILSGAGQAEKAKQYLELASKARLLPEEQKLVEKAMKGG
jgi:tetratricopeptide (TPR) repeat protein